MKKFLLSLTLMLTFVTSFAQSQPFEFNYQWTLSGKEYVTVSAPLYELGKGFSFDTVAGFDTRDNTAPAFGAGLSYNFANRQPYRGEIYAKAGVFLLMPQKATPDLGLGISVGYRF